MRGDLDSIALKALEKDRSRRYGSPSDFAADIERYLNDEAVLAMPASAAYRVGKFARRHRWGLVTACAFALVLIMATVVSVRQSLRANREAAAAEAVNDFLQNDLLAQASAANQSGPSTKPDPDLKVRTALDRAADRITGKFDKQPELEASIRDTIGQTYLGLGLYREAGMQLDRALDLHRRGLGAANPTTAKTLSRLGSIAVFQNKNAEAETLLGQALEIQRRVLRSEHPDMLYSMNGLANAYFQQGKYAQAEALYIQTLGIRRRILGPEHRDTLQSMHNLAQSYASQGKYAQAEALLNQTVEIERRVLGPEHPSTLLSMVGLTTVDRAQSKYAQAEAVDVQLLENYRRALGPESRWTLGETGNLANDYRLQGKYTQAEALDGQALVIQRRVLGPDDRDTVWSTSNLAKDYCAQGKYAQAEALYRRPLESSSNNPLFLKALAWYLVAAADRRQRRPTEALQLARGAVKEAPDCDECHNTLGLAEYRNGLWDEAVATLNRSAVLDNGTQPTDFFFLAMAHWKRGDKGEAERFFQRGVDGARKSGGGDDMDLRMFWGEAAGLLEKPGPVPTLLEAQADPERVMETLKRGVVPGRFQVADLQTSPDLAPLRGRADFQALLVSARSPVMPAR